MSNITSVFDWTFHSVDTTILGSVGMMMILIIVVVFALLMMFNANKFTTFGFITSLMFAFAMYAYTAIGWIAVLGGILGGVIIATALIWIFKI